MHGGRRYPATGLHSLLPRAEFTGRGNGGRGARVQVAASEGDGSRSGAEIVSRYSPRPEGTLLLSSWSPRKVVRRVVERHSPWAPLYARGDAQAAAGRHPGCRRCRASTASAAVQLEEVLGPPELDLQRSKGWLTCCSCWDSRQTRPGGARASAEDWAAQERPSIWGATSTRSVKPPRAPCTALASHSSNAPPEICDHAASTPLQMLIKGEENAWVWLQDWSGLQGTFGTSGAHRWPPVPNLPAWRCCSRLPPPAGIRSFSPDNQNVIEFYKPLTLIVGHNGAGKTVRAPCGRRRPLRLHSAPGRARGGWAEALATPPTVQPSLP